MSPSDNGLASEVSWQVHRPPGVPNRREEDGGAAVFLTCVLTNLHAFTGLSQCHAAAHAPLPARVDVLDHTNIEAIQIFIFI